MEPYVPLWCKSNFSFLEGASHPHELIEIAVKLGLPSLALTDRDGVYGVVRAHVAARDSALKLIVGSEVTIDDGSTIVLLAESRSGYASLCRLLSTGRLRSPKGVSSVTWDEVCSHADNLIALWGGRQSLLVRLDDAWDPAGHRLADAFGDRLYGVAARHRRPEERQQEKLLRTRLSTLGILPVASTEVLYHSRARQPLQDVLTCLRHGVTLRTAGDRLNPNAEHALKTPAAFGRLFAHDPDAVRRTLEVAERCIFSMGDIRYRYPSETLPDGMTSIEWLRVLTLRGAADRYGGAIPHDVMAQIEKELALIEELDYCGYFLTMVEIVRFCRAQEILCQGRGSAANSAVCYCLGITAIDPVRMGLLFERFISRERAEPPDIDLDIQHNRREEVIQHVFHKYGRTHAAMVANVIRYRSRMAIRDVGKVLGLPETSLDRASKILNMYEKVSDTTFRDAGMDIGHRTHRQLLALAKEIYGFPRHLSIHPGGFLLGHEPVHDLVPIENATMPGRTVIQWDKDDVEEMGLFKVDLLGLGALSHLDLCFKLLRQHRGVDLSMATIPADDPQTYAMIQRADTVGVFQIESRAQMAMLPRLRPANYYDLVVEVSLVRPGPISGGMVHPYLRRRNGEEPIVYPHPSLEPVLKKTLGVPLFQEQVMKLAVVAAGYSPGEADRLRRDMAAWRIGGKIGRHHDTIVPRMVANGIAPEFAERVFEQIKGFGEYGFPESHAASFALIAYATAYLRCHYPAEFVCGLLNAWPMGFYSPATIVGDALRHGVEIRPVDIQRSQWECTLEPRDPSGFAVQMGLRYVSGLHESSLKRVVPGFDGTAYDSLQDVVLKTDLDMRSLENLATAGAFDGYGIERREALWRIRGLVAQRGDMLTLSTEDDPETLAPLDDLDRTRWDYDASQHSTRGHPLSHYRSALQAHGLPDAKGVSDLKNGTAVRYAGLVICRQHPATANGVTFLTLEDETGFVNLVVWEQVFRKFRTTIKTTTFLGVTGKVQREQDVVHVVASAFWKPDVPMGTIRARSRDFR